MAGAPVAGTGPDRSERPEGRPVRRAPATPPRVAVAGDRLWLARRVGEIRPGGVEGFYAGDTRLLSRLEWRSTVREGEGRLRRRSRLRLDDDGALLELRWRAEARGPLTALVELALEGDFADLMEVRGFVEPRPRTPETAADRASGRIRWRHAGADGVERWLEIELDPVPGEMDTCSAVWRFRLAAGEEARIRCRLRPGRRPPLGLPCSRRRSAPPPGTGRADRRLAWEAGGARVEFEPAAAGAQGASGARGMPLPGSACSAGPNGIWRRSPSTWEPAPPSPPGRPGSPPSSAATPCSPPSSCCPSARRSPGRRWRRWPPGRVAARRPGARRSRAASPTSSASARRPAPAGSPTAATTVPSTPRRSSSGWPPRPGAGRATAPGSSGSAPPSNGRWPGWSGRGHGDPEGFLSFEPHAGRHGAEGLRTQAWKDSADSMVDERGRPVEPPLAVVEVQGYVVAALRAWAEVLAELGEEGRAAGLRREADRLAERIEARFWLPREGSYALALGARRGAARRRAGAVTSDAAHLLWAGVAAPERAAALARRLLAPDLFTGWGLRTLSAANPAYHPLAYHRGAVWPHDTAVAVAGLARYGHLREAYDLAAALLDAGAALPRHRLPECFSGAERPPATPPAGDRNGGAAGGRPEEYPAACRPQAWAAGAPFLVVAALAGLELDAVRGRIRLRPFLGGGEGERALAAVRLRGLAVGGQRLDLEIRRLAGRELEVRLRRLGARRSEERRRLEEGAETFFALRA